MIYEEGLWNGRGYELLFFASVLRKPSLNVEGGASFAGARELFRRLLQRGNSLFPSNSAVHARDGRSSHARPQTF